MHRLRQPLIALLAALLAAAPAAAQDAAPDAPIEPPALVTDATPAYPPIALAARREADIALILTIDATGAVTAAELADPLDPADPAARALADAARGAAPGLRFTPARQAGAPIAVRARYVYRFRLPPPAPAAPAAPAPPAAPEPPEPPDPPDDRLLVVDASPAAARRRSAEAVHVIDTAAARRRTTDLGDLLARTEGVGVRRAGGLGSGTRLSLNGLTDDQIRVLIDGVPIEYTGYGVGLANLPLDLIDRVEIHRGVVPIRFGADALGGTIDLVTRRAIDGTGAAAAAQIGSFGTRRLSLGAHHRFTPGGLFVRADGFYDVAENDYPIDVELIDARGRPAPATVDRFHDAWRARGAGLEVGVTDRPWADWLSLRAFVTDQRKELQHNVVMTRPFGEPVATRRAWGATLRHEVTLADLTLALQAGYGHRQSDFLDVGEWLYDWRGERILPRRTPGELDGMPHDRTTWEHATYARAHATWRLHPKHTLRLALAPTHSARTGTERRRLRPEDRDPLALDRSVTALVSGLEYELDLFDGRVENITFAKHYLHRARSEKIAAGGIDRAREATLHHTGFGDALRVRLHDTLTLKASYEHAARLPRPDELFGDAITTVANLDLRPETSHNLNLGLAYDSGDTRAGALRAQAHGFARLVDDLIVLWGTDQVQSYQNVYAADALGVEASLGYTTPGRWLALDGNLTWQDFRNASSQGFFGEFDGDRIPNRPWLFANAEARLRAADAFTAGLDLELAAHTRYVHAFYRGWESIGALDTKQTVPAQWVHGITALARYRAATFDASTAVELHNLSDERTYDFFGVQRPGRALYWKTTLEL